MWTPRFRLRTLMIVIALLTPVLAITAFWLQLNSALNAFYGPGGVLDRGQRFSEEWHAGDEALRLECYREAEARYRSALDLEASLPGEVGEVSGILIGLADALVGQGRDDEAEPLY